MKCMEIRAPNSARRLRLQRWPQSRQRASWRHLYGTGAITIIAPFDNDSQIQLVATCDQLAKLSLEPTGKFQADLRATKSVRLPWASQESFSAGGHHATRSCSSSAQSRLRLSGALCEGAPLERCSPLAFCSLLIVLIVFGRTKTTLAVQWVCSSPFGHSKQRATARSDLAGSSGNNGQRRAMLNVFISSLCHLADVQRARTHTLHPSGMEIHTKQLAKRASRLGLRTVDSNGRVVALRLTCWHAN